MQAYLDNSATTRCSERAKDLMVKVLMEDYGNPSSLHTMGVVAERYIKEAKERIAKTLKADEKEILFTSGGTESNNMALIGTALANKRAGNHISRHRSSMHRCFHRWIFRRTGFSCDLSYGRRKRTDLTG